MNRYESPLRTEQQELTRQRILEAVVREITERQPEELSFASIAARAKIAERTVYRHFATKEALMDAFWTWWIAGPFGVPTDVPMAADELPSYIARMYEAFDRHEKMSRALVLSAAGREVRTRSRSGRMKMIEATLQPLTRKLAPEARKQALAVFQMLLSINTWHTLRDFRKLTGPEAARAAAWATQVLIDELRRNPSSLEKKP